MGIRIDREIPRIRGGSRRHASGLPGRSGLQFLHQLENVRYRPGFLRPMSRPEVHVTPDINDLSITQRLPPEQRIAGTQKTYFAELPKQVKHIQTSLCPSGLQDRGSRHGSLCNYNQLPSPRRAPMNCPELPPPLPHLPPRPSQPRRGRRPPGPSCTDNRKRPGEEEGPESPVTTLRSAFAACGGERKQRDGNCQAAHGYTVGQKL